MRTQSKYKSRRTVVEGISFASKREATRYQELRLLERAGEIQDLKLQVPFVLIVNGVKVGKMVVDFEYKEQGKRVLEDAKGMRDSRNPAYALFKLKSNLLFALTGERVREV